MSFLSGSGIGNEIAFYIFDYPPEDELRVREHIEFLLEHIPKQQARDPGHAHQPVRLRPRLPRGARLLEKSFELQREKGDEALLKALKGVLHEEKVAQRFGRGRQARGTRSGAGLRRGQRLSAAALPHPAEQPALHHGARHPW